MATMSKCKRIADKIESTMDSQIMEIIMVVVLICGMTVSVLGFCFVIVGAFKIYGIIFLAALGTWGIYAYRKMPEDC
jgi:uncharacterized membrane protein YkvI